MTERKQLELAAKACGVKFVVMNGWRGDVVTRKDSEDGGGLFDPATNQLDSDRMGAKLRMNVEWEKYGVMCCGEYGPETYYERFSDHNNDENAALMAARMKCAVAIGEGMK